MSETKWAQWHTCPLCHQEYHGYVRCALGWYCWATYLDGAADENILCRAMLELGLSLPEDEAFAVLEPLVGHRTLGREARAKVAMHFAKVCHRLGLESNKLNPYKPPVCGLTMMRPLFDGCQSDFGNDEMITHRCALELGVCLLEHNLVAEATRFLPEQTLAVFSLGEDHALTIEFRLRYAQALYKYHFFGHDGYRADLVQAVTLLNDLRKQSTRILGFSHPTTLSIYTSLVLAFNEQLEWSLNDWPAEIRRGYRFL